MTMYAGHMSMTVPAAEFKAKCLALLDQVAETGEEIVVTKRGKAVARLSPLEEPKPLRGSVTFLVDDEELIKPLPVEWDAERD